jgi:uncharacterized protein (DUF697 family)
LSPAGVSPKAVFAAVRELRAKPDAGPLVVAGAPALVPLLAKELRAGGEASAVQENGSLEGASVLVYVLAGAPTEDDVATLRRADRDEVPIVCLARPEVEAVPYVLATDLVHVEGGAGFPLETIARVLAHKLGDRGSALARRLPLLRQAVCDALVSQASRRNAILAAAIFVPGADMPVLTLNQIRLVLRIAQAYGHDVDRERALEILPVIAGGLGLRTVVRELLDFVPVAGWALKGAVAYAGTRAIGEAAVRYFEAGGPAVVKKSPK